MDSHGPRIFLACSSQFLIGGYSGLAPDALSALAMIFYTLLLCSLLTGVGGAGASQVL